MTEAPRSGVLERVTLLVDCLSEAPGRLGLEEVAEITGLPRSTTFRMLQQLSEMGWVDHESRGYSVGPRLGYGSATSDVDDLRSQACAVLNDLAANTGAVAHLAVMRGGFVQYLDKIGGAAAASVPTRIGTRIVASEASAGLAILASLDHEAVESILVHAGIGRDVIPDSLYHELAEVRRRKGISYFDGSGRAAGVTSIGAAIMGPDGPVGAIAVARRGALSLRTIGPMVLSAAEDISAALDRRAG